MEVLTLQIHVTEMTMSVSTLPERKWMISITWNLYQQFETIRQPTNNNSQIQPYTKTLLKMTASSLTILVINTNDSIYLKFLQVCSSIAVLGWRMYHHKWQLPDSTKLVRIHQNIYTTKKHIKRHSLSYL